MNPEYTDLLKYIDEYWERCLFGLKLKQKGNNLNRLMKIGRINLPNPSVAPNHLYFANTQFYWDTYFTVLGLLNEGREELAKAMVDNLAYLYQRFGLFPARNTALSKGRSQPPFFSSMVWEIYDHGAADGAWLNKQMSLAAREYAKVWNAPNRLVPELKLNRYHPRYMKSRLTTYESGWDASTRFYQKSVNLIPVDLNCLLYRYETDLLRYAKLQKNSDQTKMRESHRKLRQKSITKYLWDERAGFFYDYNLSTNQLEPLQTLAGYFPLWAKIATKQQAELCRQKLVVFEQPYGLATTEKITWKARQWDYPNGWAPLHYIVIKGLRNYGFNKDANRITNKWLDLQTKVFKNTGQMWEKYNVISGGIGRPGRYSTQPGFSWSNGVFLCLLRDLKAQALA